MLRTGIAVGTALIVTCAFGVTPAHAARLTVKGTGFRLATRLGVTSVSPSRQYTVTFASAELKRRYTPHLTAAVAQLRAAGVTMSVGGVERTDPSVCPPTGHIHYTEKYRPAGRGGYSLGRPCPDPAEGVAAGGVVTMDSEYHDGTWHIAPYQVRNTSVHEMLHVLGLDHPNLDLDGDGAAGPYECPAGPGGTRPVMCSPNGGHRTAGAGRLTGFDIEGIEALLANARRQGVG
ncbi:hypothetical protein DB35_17060 [Streptomyces abyssalis]|uniref:Peptidase M10 metallopeptidase domain-containing protein n=1 Tax=Streptomyces abyssalis TaxID=933944 RepID=A0A1E7JKE5_9ACTN|nr:hypothetical protein [Streptomyces abyssalis]OEU88121.1 hypothetical protein AN215_18235 [Streptomyces abyssalis]OEU90992.1 hypothetical protein DB35_17060 [Streptomyces abyssalis]